MVTEKIEKGNLIRDIAGMLRLQYVDVRRLDLLSKKEVRVIRDAMKRELARTGGYE